MALEAALYELTGAGLVACAAGLGIAVPPGAVRSGDAFVGFLSQRGAWGEVNRLVEEIKRESLQAASAAMTSETELAGQIAEAIAVLEDVRPEAELLRTALDPAAQAASDGALVAPATQIAAQLIARAAAAHPPHRHVPTPQSPAAGPSHGAQLVLHRLFAHLLREPALIRGLGPALQEYLAVTFPPHAAPVLAAMATPPLPALAAAPPPANPTSAATSPPPIRPGLVAVAMAARASAPGSGTIQLFGPYGVGAAYAASLVATGVLAALDGVRQTHGLSEGAYARFLRTLESQACPPQATPLRLADMAVWLTGLIASLTKASNEDSDTRRLKSEAARALAAGDLEGAVQRLKNVRRSAREGRRRIEERLREDIMLLNEQMAGEANVIARQAELELTRRDYAAAAELFAEARDSLPRSEIQSSWLYAMRQGEALFRLGDEFDDSAALADSARVYASCLTLASREEAPRNWVAAQCGIALAQLRHAERQHGERTADTAALGAAIEAWRAALAVLDTLDEPGQTIVSRRHLARALVLRGERDSDVAPLEEAAQLFRDLMAAIPRAGAPLDWADAHMGLAGALLTRDERCATSGDGRALDEAIAALEAALTVYARESHPTEWSTARMNMGNALLAMGDRERNRARYGDAVVCFEEALSVQARATAPGNWALIQTNLGNAHAAIGEQARDAAHLERAIDAYRKALEVLTGPDDVLRRAIAELNLGTVLVRLAEHREPQRHWGEAMAVMLSARETFKARRVEAFVAIAEVNLRSLHKASRGILQAKAS